MSNVRYSTGLWTWGTLGDRFTMAGYRQGLEPLEAIERATRVKGLHGLEFTYPDNCNEDNVEQVVAALKAAGLGVSSIYNNISSHPKWQRGAFTASAELRREALAHLKRCMDVSAALGAHMVTFSLLQDGFDYPFQADYARARRLIVETLQEAADYRKDVRIGLEFKSREPRVFCFIATTPGTLMLAQEVGRDNVGVVIDTGHALMSRENVAESMVLLSQYGKLLHTHMNDNYRGWDDDLIVGSVNFFETMEMVYWMRRVGYSGWYGLDIFPYREEPGRACEESIANLELCHTVIDRIGMDRLGELIAAGESTETIREIRKAAFGV